MKAVIVCVLLLAPLVLARTEVQGDEFAKLKHMFAGLFGGGRMGADVAGATTAPAAGTTTTAPAAGTTTTPATATTTTAPATPATQRSNGGLFSPPDFDTRHIPGSKKYLNKPGPAAGSWLQATVVKLSASLSRRNKVCRRSRVLHGKFKVASKAYNKANRRLTRKQNYYNTVPVTSAPKYVSCVSFYQKRFSQKSSEWQLKHPNYMENKRAACASKETNRRAAIIAKLQSTADTTKAALDKVSEKYNAKKSQCKSLHQSFRQELQAAIDETSQRKKTIAGKKNVAFSNYRNAKNLLEKLIQKAKATKYKRNKFAAKHKKLVRKLRAYRQVLANLKRVSV